MIEEHQRFYICFSKINTALEISYHIIRISCSARTVQWRQVVQVWVVLQKPEAALLPLLPSHLHCCHSSTINPSWWWHFYPQCCNICCRWPQYIYHDSWWWHFHHRLVSICIFQCTRLLTNQVQGFRAFGFWYSSLALVRRQGNLPEGKSVCSVCILSVLADSTIGWRAFQRPNQRRPVKCSPERLDVNFSPVCVCVAYPYPSPATSSSLPIIPHICI